MPKDNHIVDKSLEKWLWDAACSIRGARDAPKYKEYILPLVFAKRLCDVYDDEITRIGSEVGGREEAFTLVQSDKKLVRFFIPIVPVNPDDPVWSVIRSLKNEIGEGLTSCLNAIALQNPSLAGIINRVDFSAVSHGQRDIADDRLKALIEQISLKRLGLNDVDADIIGRSYEYLIRKFAEGSGQSAGEFYTPKDVGIIMARILAPEPGMEVHDPCCGSGGLLINCQTALRERMEALTVQSGLSAAYAPLKIFGQEYEPNTWAMANMNMIIHDMHGIIEIGDTFKTPKFSEKGRLKTFDRVVANPPWNQDWFSESDYDADELGRFPKGCGFPGKQSADWGWVQHIFAALNENGRAAVVLDTGAVSRGSGSPFATREKKIRKWYVDNDLIEGVVYLPANLFYNTKAQAVILFLTRNKPADHRNQIFLVNASRVAEKGDTKNFIPYEGIIRIVETYNAWKEERKFACRASKEDVINSDYNLSPTCYIPTEESEEYRPIGDILDDLNRLEVEIEEADASLRSLLNTLSGK